jgi:SAM-dependent methyltransferase
VIEPGGELFDAIAEDYDRFRPGYPPALVDEACAIAGLRPGSPVLEIGCGTGQLTVALAERGLRIDAVDPGPNMVAAARRRAPVARFHVGRFEDVELPAGGFAAVFSAAAFHWVEPDVGWVKVARLLRPGGVLALLWHFGGALELDDGMLGAWRAVLPEAASWGARDDATLWAGADARIGNVSELWAWLGKRRIARPEAARLFADVRLSKLPIERAQDVDAVLGEVRTTSAYLRLDADGRRELEARLARVVEAEGGTHRMRTYATLVTARAA